MRIIGITGLKRSGKNTVGDYLEEVHGYKQVSFASKLKEVTLKYLGPVSLSEDDRENDQVFMTTYRNIILCGQELGIPTESLYDFQTRYIEVLKEFELPESEQSDAGIVYKTSYRKVLQLFGTDVCRHFIDSIWVKQVEELINLDYKTRYVVTDVRFDNEAEMIRRVGGKMIETQREGCVRDGHVSEAGVDEELIDFIVQNTTFEELFEQVRNIVGG